MYLPLLLIYFYLGPIEVVVDPPEEPLVPGHLFLPQFLSVFLLVLLFLGEEGETSDSLVFFEGGGLGLWFLPR
jgi:hypothetical protein